jgi:hypothetical protein
MAIRGPAFFIRKIIFASIPAAAIHQEAQREVP